MNTTTPHRRGRWRLGAVALALALASATLPAQTTRIDPKASRFYEDALARYEKKDYAGAIVQLKNALQIDRKMLPVQVLLGKALLADRQPVPAQVALEEALALGVNPIEVVVPLAEALGLQGKPGQILSDPRLAHAALPAELKAELLLIKASAASDLGQPRDALRLLEEARALDSSSAKSWLAEVPIRVRAKQLKEARVAADKAVALDPKSAEAAYQLATVPHVQGDLKSAVELYSRVLALKADHVDALVARAGVHMDLGRFAEADADVKAARKAAPKDARAAYLAAMLAERAGQAAETRDLLNQVTNLLDPWPPEFVRYRPQLLILGGMSHYALGQYAKAKPYLETALRQDQTSPVAKLLAQIYLKEKNNGPAVETLELYLRSHPGDTAATMQLAATQMSLGRHARAAQLIQESLKRSDTPQARSMLGMSLVGAGKIAGGAAELEAALKKDPDQIPAGVTLTGLYLASGQVGKAVTLAQQLAKRQPENPGIQNLLGSALAAKGDAAGARAAFERTVKLAPTFVEPRLNLARLDIGDRQFDIAEKRLQAILNTEPKHVDASVEMARLMDGRNKPDDAQRWLERADDVAGANLKPGVQLVEFHLARGRPDRAREALKRLQAKAPEALLVLLTQARVALAGNDTSGARSVLTRASTLANYDAPALAQIATLQLQAGDLAGAGHTLDKALNDRPDHLRARTLMAEVELQRGEVAKAEQRAKAILAAEPKLAVGHVLMGQVALAKGQLPAAIESFRRAHQIDQSSESLSRLFTATELRDRPAAIALAEQWLRTRPRDATILRTVADARARSGNMPAAKAAYEELLKVSPNDAEALNNLANVLVILKDPQAIKVAERALALKPDVPHIIGTTGWAALHAGQADRALQLLRDVRLRDPNNADARYFLGVALAQRGRASEARTELEGALKAGTRFSYAKQAEELLGTLR